jgi:hypothetical protein
MGNASWRERRMRRQSGNRVHLIRDRVKVGDIIIVAYVSRVMYTLQVCISRPPLQSNSAFPYNLPISLHSTKVETIKQECPIMVSTSSCP